MEPMNSLLPCFLGSAIVIYCATINPSYYQRLLVVLCAISTAHAIAKVIA